MCEHAPSTDSTVSKTLSPGPLGGQPLWGHPCLYSQPAKGAIHEVFIHFDASRTEAEGGGIEQAENHYYRAMELNEGQSISPHVALAEAVCIKRQDRDTFEQLLQKVLEFDVDQYPEFRLSNILAQRRAEFLLENIEDYFI